jgi:signal transduction histidine kinase
MKKISLDGIIDSAQEDIAARLAANAMQIKREGLRDLSVSGHEGLIKQALLNLLDNALKYAAVENGLITISTLRENSFAVLSVTDQGPGIPEKDKLRLFERFYRIDKARSRESGGTGLGLAIVKHIALAHSGSVRIESKEGQGSTFSLLLPLYEPMHALADATV